MLPKSHVAHFGHPGWPSWLLLEGWKNDVKKRAAGNSSRCVPAILWSLREVLNRRLTDLRDIRNTPLVPKGTVAIFSSRGSVSPESFSDRGVVIPKHLSTRDL